MPDSEKSGQGSYRPNPIQGFDIEPLPNIHGDGALSYHIHDGVDSPKVSDVNVAGEHTHIQFNHKGHLTGDPMFTFDKDTGTLTLLDNDDATSILTIVNDGDTEMTSTYGITLIGGDSAEFDGSDIALIAGSATAGVGTSGGDILLNAGWADFEGGGDGGDIIFEAGNGDNSGGQLQFTAGDGINGSGGSIDLFGGNSDLADGGDITISGGDANGGAYGEAGSVSITSGIADGTPAGIEIAGGDTDGLPGGIVMYGGDGSAGNAAGTIEIEAGSGVANQDSDGGAVRLIAGNASTASTTGASMVLGGGGAGSGGAIDITAGAGSDSSGNGGDIFLAAGEGLGTRRHGSVIIARSRVPMSPTDIGTPGAIAVDHEFIYVCVGPDQWLRADLLTWTPSASLSPSSSTSRSSSASRSPSASTSPSASRSPSASLSPSHSASASKSPSASISMSN